MYIHVHAINEQSSDVWRTMIHFPGDPPRTLCGYCLFSIINVILVPWQRQTLPLGGSGVLHVLTKVYLHSHGLCVRDRSDRKKANITTFDDNVYE